MSTLSRIRINNIKRNLKINNGKEDYSKIIIKAKEGLFLFDLVKKQRQEIDRFLPGYEINDFSNVSIDKILVIGSIEHTPTAIIDDIDSCEENEDILNFFDKNNMLNLKELPNDKLQELIDCCDK